MSRWLAYSGSPILLEELLYKPEHSLIDQSLHARLGTHTTNGDGFGVGWYYANTDTPVVFRSIVPAWNERNLRALLPYMNKDHAGGGTQKMLNDLRHHYTDGEGVP